ncbi:UDP-N-acetylmuramate--L-alanine ligase [Patescibacteria group bacterium]
MLDLNKIKTAYFVGIGGIGVSALARIFLKHKIKVFGSDLIASEITDDLTKLGAEIKIGPQVTENIKENYDVLIYTPAIPDNHPELTAAKTRKIKCFSYPEALAELVNKNFGIAVTGTHGKTSTTAMLGKVLVDSGIDPTVVVGSNLKEFKGNAYAGKSKYFVFEACEYKNSFLNYKPQIAVVTNVELDHPDVFKNIDQMREAYEKFLQNLPKDGLLIYWADDPQLQKITKDFDRKAIKYGLKNKSFDFSADNIKTEDQKMIFEVFEKEKSIGEFELQVPGEHNILNALAVISVARHLDVDLNKIKESLKSFQGSWRRLSKRAEINDILILDDYGHHPTEVKATLKAAKQFYPDRRVWCVYQPHHHDRTEALFNDFIPAFDNADVVLMTEIYTVSGREDKDEKHDVSSKDLYEKIKKRHKEIYYQPTLDKTEQFLAENLKPGDVCILMGAGDIYDIGEGLVEKLQSK